jgi:hypothetical protein
MRADGPDIVDEDYLALSRFDVSFRSEAHMNWEVRQVHLSARGSDGPFPGSAPVA